MAAQLNIDRRKPILLIPSLCDCEASLRNVNRISSQQFRVFTPINIVAVDKTCYTIFKQNELPRLLTHSRGLTRFTYMSDPQRERERKKIKLN